MDERDRLLPIVLVEDDEVDVVVVQRALRRAAIDAPLHLFSDGESAHEALVQKAAGDNYFLTLDLNLPCMSGFELLEELLVDRHVDPSQVVIMSTSDRSSDVARARELGVRDYVCKSQPNAMQRLLERYREFLSQS